MSLSKAITTQYSTQHSIQHSIHNNAVHTCRMASPAEIVCGRQWHLDYNIRLEDGTVVPMSPRIFCGETHVVCSARLGLVCLSNYASARCLRTYWLNPATYEFEVVSTAFAPPSFANTRTVCMGYLGADSPNMVVVRVDVALTHPGKMTVVCLMDNTFVQLQTISCAVPRVWFGPWLGDVQMNACRAVISDDGARMAIVYGQVGNPHFQRDGAVVVVFERSEPSAEWLPRVNHFVPVSDPWTSLLFLDHGSKVVVLTAGKLCQLWDIGAGSHVDIDLATVGTCTWCGSRAPAMFPRGRFAPYNDCCVMECCYCGVCRREFSRVIRVCARSVCDCCPLPAPVGHGSFWWWRMPYELGLATSWHEHFTDASVLGIRMILLHPKACMTFVRTAWMCAVVRACMAKHHKPGFGGL